MKKYSTRFLKAVAIGYFAFPIAFLGVSLVLFTVPALSLVRLLLSPSYYFLSLIAVLTGFGLWEMKRWAWYIFLLTNILINYSVAIILAEYGSAENPVGIFIGSLIVSIYLIFRIGREVAVPYLLPKIRWWESNPRYRLQIPTTIIRSTGAVADGQILDMSTGGVFIRISQDLLQDEWITIRFSVFKTQMEMSGVIVWRSQSSVTHPKGVGLKFAPLDRAKKKTMKAITQRLRKIGRFYRQGRYLLPEEEFSRRMLELQAEPLNLSV